jgi:ABC-2 type transport system permease protein
VNGDPLTGAGGAPAALRTGLGPVLSRYARLLRLQLRMSGVTAMQYRADFIVRGLLAVMWIGVTLVPFFVVFGTRPTIAGWTFAEALLVVAWFTLLKAILEGAVSPSLTAVVEHVRRGTLDFVLLKPADAQFLVSTTKFEPWRILDFAGAMVLFGYAFHLLGRWPTPAAVALALVFLIVAVLILYSFWILVVSASFWVVKVDNLSYLFGSAFDVARWPVTIFRGAFLRFIFTVLFPLAVMTTYPSLALLGKLPPQTAILAIGGGVLFAAVARRVWLRALRLYTSASS